MKNFMPGLWVMRLWEGFLLYIHREADGEDFNVDIFLAGSGTLKDFSYNTCNTESYKYDTILFGLFLSPPQHNGTNHHRTFFLTLRQWS